MATRSHAEQRSLRDRVLRAARAMPAATPAQIAAKVGCHPRTTVRHLSRAPRRGSPLRPVHQQIIRGGRDIARCPPRLLRRCSMDPSWTVCSHAALHPGCLPSTLAQLAVHDDWGVRECAARHPRCPPVFLSRLACDENTQVRESAACHPRCPPEALLRLADDSSQRIRVQVAGNPNCPPRLLARLATDPDQRTRDAAQRRVLPPPPWG